MGQEKETMGSTRITVAPGDGIGPEIMEATLLVLREAGARLETVTIDIGERVYQRGVPSGIDADAWASLRSTRVLLKAPVTTPQGGGYKSVNVTLRKTLGLFANVRPCTAYPGLVPTKHPGMELIIVRENEEDLYAGIEHRQTRDVYQTLKLVSRPGTERIMRFAFELARRQGRKKVSCFTKDNIMKLTDGLFHRTFDEVAREYPDLQNEHLIVDFGAAKLADTPEAFDVIVLPNLYGDILSDVAAQIAGSVGLAPSANVGSHGAMFEAIHGSAPTLAGQDVANPSGLLLSGAMMLVHLGRQDIAERVHNAWLRALEDGVRTRDLARDGTPWVGTQAFAREVAARLGKEPEQRAAVRYPAGEGRIEVPARPPPARLETKQLVGVDVFVEWRGSPDALAEALQPCSPPPLELSMITNRGVKVWPKGLPETFCTDHWRCRFSARDGAKVELRAITALLDGLIDAGIEFVKMEQLYLFDGAPGFSLGQGQ
jgi:isocitrate dehydrogenase